MADKKKGPGASENAPTMADKKKGVGADSGSSPKHSKVSKIFDSLNKICCIAKELKDDALGVDELERLLDNQKKLSEQLKAKDAQIADLTAEVESLKTAKSLLWEEFQERYQDLSTELDGLRDVKTDLEETRIKLEEAEESALAAKNENKMLRLGVEKTAEHKKMADEQLKSTLEELENLRLRSAGVEVKYRELTGLIGEDQLQDRNAIVLRTILTEFSEDELEGFAAMCHEKILTALLAIPIPTPMTPPLEIPRTASHAMVPAMQPPPVARASLDSIPLPWSTSKEAKLMRCAFAEHVFAKALVDHVFVDIPTRHAPVLQQAARTILGFLEGKDAQREAIVRSQLLAVLSYDSDDDSDMEYAIHVAFEYVRDTLDAVVPPGDARSSVYVMLAGLLRQAASMWMSFRRSRYRISAELDVHWRRLVRADDCYRDYGDPELGRHTYEVIVPLFPQIVMGQNILVNPRVLWSDQGAVVSAREELKEATDRRGPKDEDFPNKQPRRRNSIRPSMVAPAQPPRFALRRMMSDSMSDSPPVSGGFGKTSN
ncbi:hypothetical protein B0T18DRAFT_387562 [Schizothecium vesticola]|uniref:Uncharacterized protein n=1 Tax=Schizothecium vesticola TaxID=314040 RepID=A0AA40F554_9PEZI|nr:hypothetical protein B0T18DRAFT_387562 [Schizothecium vesticola]